MRVLNTNRSCFFCRCKDDVIKPTVCHKKNIYNKLFIHFYIDRHLPGVFALLAGDFEISRPASREERLMKGNILLMVQKSG